ncbi:MAG: hypothetical protein ACRD9S_21060 [Pyrinomonadaceae bacterium]
MTFFHFHSRLSLVTIRPLHVSMGFMRDPEGKPLSRGSIQILQVEPAPSFAPIFQYRRRCDLFTFGKLSLLSLASVGTGTSEMISEMIPGPRACMDIAGRFIASIRANR